MLLRLNNDQTPPPFIRFGGKGASVEWYRSLLPPHHTFVEPYCGSAALLFAKPRSKVEVINDIDSNVWNFFTVLRDKEKSAQLVELLTTTPYSRKEFELCRELISGEKDSVERARMFFVLSQQAFGAMVGKAWSYGRTSMKSFHTNLGMFGPQCERLQQVQVENLPALTVIEKYDSPRTVFFVDPPYLPETRVRKQAYAHEMSDEDHRVLLSRLSAVAGKVLLCGYPSTVYDEMLKGWRKVERKAPCHTGGLKNGEAQRPERTEVVWMNFGLASTKLAA